MFDTSRRITRRRSSAGPIPPQRPQQPRPRLRDSAAMVQQREGTGGQRPTFLTLRDHGKVYVADLPRLSDGQLTHINKEAQDVLDSLNRRLQELEAQTFLSEADQDTRIRATTKRDITQRFLNSIAQEQELRRSNPALRAAAGESLARAFLELARHRLPGSTFDSLLQEALSACGPSEDGSLAGEPADPQVVRLLQRAEAPQPRPAALPVVLSPDPADALSA
ncbi:MULTISPECIES: hypothetical protein [unclassified Cyanobium]|uniref:hypothetical protein n=1 Tax=unclassified Cyanobium TaxID=2627006 RepID=UPI0020CDC476|nr:MULTISPECIES: hypothetical protein [unclassified Cyanobium]MCP9859564.1 hypothetical protein [Cyanobium sp. Cruz-8H5]MCP9867333.1 hypothetical protein [Cyanobium sp. Cruz-8D1]